MARPERRLRLVAGGSAPSRASAPRLPRWPLNWPPSGRPPIADGRASAAYRARMVPVLARRLLVRAGDEA